MTNNDSAILVVEQLRKDFGPVAALRGIDFVLDRPGVYGFLGPNGAGKTTTFKLVSALLHPTGGRVLIDGVDVRRDPRTALSKLGVQFDAPGFYPYLTARENLHVIACWQGHGSEKIDELLTLTDLANAAHRRVGGYSWGMKQRLALAAALLADPRLLLLDEPTNGLDPAGIADIRRLLPRLAYEQGRTVLLSSHRMEEVEQVCDRLIIIHQGAIVAQGTPAELAAGDPWIELHCADAQAAAGILREVRGVGRIERTGVNRLHISASGVPASTINRALLNAGIAVEQIVERRESLEDAFFRLTGTRSNEK